MTRRTGEPPHLSTRRKVMLTTLVVASLCAIVEGASRLVWWRLERISLRTHYQQGEAILANDAINFMKVPDGVYGYTIKPGFQSDSNTINAQGFRRRGDVPTARTPGSLRIVCLGESTTFGSDDVSNYPGLLGQILERNAIGYQHYEVINAGVPGWLSDQIALRVRRQIVDFEPDVAILYVGWNDFQAYDPMGPIASESAFSWFGRSPWMEYANSASKTVALLTALAHRHTATSAAPVTGTADDASPPDRRYRFLLDNLGTIVRELRSANPSVKVFIGTLVGLWPQGSPEAWEKITVPGWVRQRHLTPAQAAHFVEELNQQLRMFAASHQAVVIDTATIFDRVDRTRLQWDFAHMYKDGYELMAWVMFDALRSSGIVTARRSDRYQELLSAYGQP
jgi:lysophospholipase L1-like esterase